MKNSNSTEEKNLLIYDKSSKIGCIYFVGISSNIYRGKVILKKKIISDKIVRYTNLNDNLVLIKNGNFNFKQTAILIKGITIFLHRQLEVLLTDFYAMYKKCLFSDINMNNNLNKMIKRLKTNKGFKIKKKLSLQDVNRGSNEVLMNTSNYLNKNKNIANIDDLMLKESSDLNIYDYNFENDGNLNEENNIYQDILTNASSFDYSKFNNFYTANDNINNLNTLAINDEIKMKSKIDNILKFKLYEDKKKNDIEKPNNISGSIFTNKNIDRNNFSYKDINNTILRHGDIINNKINKNIENVDGKTNKNNKKRFFVEVDEEIILKDNTWKVLNTNKKKKNSDEYVDKNLENINSLFYFLNNNKKNCSDSSFSNFYELIKNCDILDARKELYNVFENIIENEKRNIQPNNLKLIQTKSAESSLKGKKNSDNLNFEELRENFNDDYFMNSNLENNQSKKKFSKNSNDSFINISDNIEYNFDKMNDFYNVSCELQEMSEQEIYFNDKNSRENNISFQNKYSNNTLSEKIRDTLSVPSSKLVSRRSFTSAQNRYDGKLLRLKNYISKLCGQFKSAVEFEHIFPLNKTTDKNASLIFYNLLVLASNDEIELIQNIPNKILIKVN